VPERMTVGAAPAARGPTYARRAMTLTTGRAEESQRLLDGLRAAGSAREAALTELHALLVRGAHHELRRRRELLAHVSHAELDDLATQAADDALAMVLAKLDTFRGASRFTTWAYKFVLLEAGVKARRRAWHGREVVTDHELWPEPHDGGRTAQERLEERELMEALRDAIAQDLTTHQREVFTALALNGVPIDVLAERLATTRGALYKTLHDARRKLRATLAGAGHDLDDRGGEQ